MDILGGGKPIPIDIHTPKSPTVPYFRILAPRGKTFMDYLKTMRAMCLAKAQLDNWNLAQDLPKTWTRAQTNTVMDKFFLAEFPAGLKQLVSQLRRFGYI